MTDKASHPFDSAVALEPLADGRLLGRTSELYWNMISPFGGVTAATVLNGVLCRPERQGDPIVLTVNFAAAIQPGEFHVVSRLTRANRSTQHWSVELMQGTEVMTSATMVLAKRRSTWGTTEAVRPAAPTVEASRRFEPKIPMRWPNMYDVRYARGELRPDNRDSITHSWIADSPPRPVDFLSLAAYCDTFAPRIFFWRPQVVPIGTVSLNVYFHVAADELALQGSGHVFGVAQGQVGHRGYFDQQGQVWGKGDLLLATTQQIVWYKE